MCVGEFTLERCCKPPVSGLFAIVTNGFIPLVTFFRY
jgi:hypothetical protein